MEAAVDLKYYLSLERRRIEESEPPEIKEIPLCEKQLWRKYRNLVWKITEKQPIHKLPHFKERGFCGYHLDHKVSIWYGYKHKLDPKMIGGIDNLEFIPFRDNMRKARGSNFKGFKGAQTIIFV